MLKSLWNSFFYEADGGPTDGAAAIDRAKLRLLFEHFPIGRKVSYYPEYKREIVLQTIIVGYRVNDHFIYSRDAVQFDGNGIPVAFVVGEKRSRLPLERVQRLRVLVPDTSEMERSLDYVSRASIGRAGQFRQGNAITLFADIGARGVPTVDTEVDQRIKMIDGPYKDERMILLEPVITTMAIEDQRRKDRVETVVPIDLYLAADQPAVRCVLGDFSDNSLRLCVAEAGYVMPSMAPNDEVIVVFSLGELSTTYRIKGIVFRGGADSCVIKMAQLYRDGEFGNFKTMDLLEIKTGLMNFRG